RHAPGGRAAAVLHPTAKTGSRSGARPADVVWRPGRLALALVVLRHAGIVPARGSLLGPAARLPVDPAGRLGGIISGAGGHRADAVELVGGGARGRAG